MILQNRVVNLRETFPTAQEFLDMRHKVILSQSDVSYLSFLVDNDVVRERSKIQIFTNQLYDLMLRKANGEYN